MRSPSSNTYWLVNWIYLFQLSEPSIPSFIKIGYYHPLPVKMNVIVVQSCPTLCNTMDMGFPKQEYWSGLSFPSPEDLPNSGIKPRSPAMQADSLPSEAPGKPTSLFRVIIKGMENNKYNAYTKKSFGGLHSVVQWLRLCTSTTGRVWSLVGELRSYM